MQGIHSGYLLCRSQSNNSYIHYLVHLQTDESSDDGSGGGDGGDDLPRDQLALVTVGRCDVIILSAKVRRGDDEVHVKIGVVVLDTAATHGGHSSNTRDGESRQDLGEGERRAGNALEIDCMTRK